MDLPYYTETYESLHKDFVKIPYQSSNSKFKTTRSFNFSTKVFEFALQNANAFFSEINGNPRINNKMKTGFEKFLECLDLYLELLNNPTIDEARIRIYGSVTLSNGAIVRATSNFHNKEWFSEVAISMSSEESDDYISDQGVCYGQVIYMFKIIY